MAALTSLRSFFSQTRFWLAKHIGTYEAVNEKSGMAQSRSVLLITCVIIFVCACGARFLYWQDKKSDVYSEKNMIANLVRGYQREAEQIVNDRRLLLPREPVEAGDARTIVHPPGYSILMATLYGAAITDASLERLILLQALADAIAATLIFFIAAEWLPFVVAVISGLLVALSPHLGYYSLWLSPDTLAVLPILAAIYLIIRANKRPRLIVIIAAGVMMGLSCWMRSNALLLAPFLAIVILLIFKQGLRLRHSLAFVLAAMVVISPITIWNWIVYNRFIPLSIGAGITFIEGIADYDTDNRFNLPQLDKDVAIKDAEWHNRPDYAGNLWTPDGVERDHYRFARGMDSVRSDPLWFMGVMIRRAGFMLRYNDGGESRWPLGTASVPWVSAEPPFGHNNVITDILQPDWSVSPNELVAGATSISTDTEFVVSDDQQSLQITGDQSQYGDQFISAAIAVEQNTDYVFRIPLEIARGKMAAKITSSDRRIALASMSIQESKRGAAKKAKKRAIQDEKETDELEEVDEERKSVVLLPFASGNRKEVRFVLSNDGSSETLAQVGQAEMVRFGSTPHKWTRYPRAVIRGLQKNLYKTGLMLPLVFVGILLLALNRRWRAIVILIAVPLYYLCFQSALHTEYRYILAIHYFLFIMAAVTIYCIGAMIKEIALWSRSRMTAIRSPE